jgi:hypothetical protein
MSIESSNTCPPSGGFKLILAKLVPKLKAAFDENKAMAGGISAWFENSAVTAPMHRYM